MIETRLLRLVERGQRRQAGQTEQRGQGQAMIQRSIWSSYPTIIGNIEINDVGEVQPSTSGRSREHQHADVEEFDMVLEERLVTANICIFLQFHATTEF